MTDFDAQALADSAMRFISDPVLAKRVTERLKNVDYDRYSKEALRKLTGLVDEAPQSAPGARGAWLYAVKRLTRRQLSPENILYEVKRLQ